MLNHSEPQQQQKKMTAQGETADSLSLFLTSRAEQIAEQSAELSTAVVLCRTWQSPFSQYDSAE